MRPKIAIISSSTPPLLTGGISSAHWNLYLALKQAGFCVKIFTYNDNGCTGQMEGDVVRHGASRLWLRLNGIINRLYLAFLQAWFGPSGQSYQFIYVLASMEGALRINRSLKTFQPNLLFLPDNGSPGFFIRPPEGCKTIFISHHNYLRFQENPILGHFSSFDARLAMFFEQKTMPRIDAVVCPSRYMKETFLRTHQYDGEVKVIPNLVNRDFIASIPPANLHRILEMPEDAPIVYIPSAGTGIKGSRYVFEIIRRLSASTRIVGFYLTGAFSDPILLGELEHIPENARLHCPGHTDYAGNIAKIKSCSFCISPTVLESFGMAILEANFCGIPVVAFNVGGNADIVADGSNGYLVPFLDMETLISRSTSLMDKQENERLKSSTWEFVNQRFATESLAGQYIELINESINTNEDKA
ncbi:glycosyltransferase family 4 protein [Methylosarcina fibrata]|uniref:glycosyltransferase family 4 protein n=1 Tax=Methylosarcina fibrata TaxID=105972 RepID=UPI00037BD7B8|nr:glycosyltransferase family 4 protein [Methylosarcina fibrata]